MNKTIYLAGKITGDPNYRAKFEAAQKFLEAQGHIVLSPAVLPSEGFSWEAYIRMSRAMLKECEAICFLPDWTDSTGALLEHKLARSWNMEMLFLTQKSNIHGGKNNDIYYTKSAGISYPQRNAEGTDAAFLRSHESIHTRASKGISGLGADRRGTGLFKRRRKVRRRIWQQDGQAYGRRRGSAFLGRNHFGIYRKRREFIMPKKSELKRLTTDDPANSEFPNYLTLMNFCTAKNGKAVLCYADGEENISLAEYTARKCQAHGKKCGNDMCADMTAAEVLDGALMELECDCANAVMYFCGAQAAENNARLKQYEDTGLTPEEILKLIQQNGEEAHGI